MPNSHDTSSPATVKVWDPFVRVFHWTVVGCFFGAYAIERPLDVHETLGWTVAGAVAARAVWGVVGSRHARFTDFVPGPRRFFGYARSLIAGTDRRYLGHNPAGGAMIVALMLMIGAIATTGWMMGLDAYFGEDWVKELHETAVTITLALVALHVGGVIVESLRHRENLVKSMITGRKRPLDD